MWPWTPDWYDAICSSQSSISTCNFMIRLVGQSNWKLSSKDTLHQKKGHTSSVSRSRSLFWGVLEQVITTATPTRDNLRRPGCASTHLPHGLLTIIAVTRKICITIYIYINYIIIILYIMYINILHILCSYMLLFIIPLWLHELRLKRNQRCKFPNGGFKLPSQVRWATVYIYNYI